MKALCELLPSGVIIIIIICKTRGLDQLISMGSSPALMLRISPFLSWEFMQTEGTGRSQGLWDCTSLGTSANKLLCSSSFPNPALAAEPQGQAMGMGKGREEELEVQGQVLQVWGQQPRWSCTCPAQNRPHPLRHSPFFSIAHSPPHLILHAIHEVIESGVRQPLIQSQLQPHTSWVTLGRLIKAALRIK